MFGRKKKRQSSECRALVEDFLKHGIDVYQRATEEELERYIDLTRRWVLYQIEYYYQTVAPLSEEENGERVWLNRKLHGCSETERKPLPVLETPYDRHWGVAIFMPLGSHRPTSEGAYGVRYWAPPVPILLAGQKVDMMSLQELTLRKLGSCSSWQAGGKIMPSPDNMRDIVDAILLGEVMGGSATSKAIAEGYKYDYFSIIEGKR